MAPKVVAPKVVAPKVVTPKVVAPKVLTPKDSKAPKTINQKNPKKTPAELAEMEAYAAISRGLREGSSECGRLLQMRRQIKNNI